jgi:hypothetical protein
MEKLLQTIEEKSGPLKKQLKQKFIFLIVKIFIRKIKNWKSSRCGFTFGGWEKSLCFFSLGLKKYQTADGKGRSEKI